jgi:hypothetical protein
MGGREGRREKRKGGRKEGKEGVKGGMEEGGRERGKEGREGWRHRVEDAELQELAQEAFLRHFGEASNIILRGLRELDPVDPFALRKGGREGGREGGGGWFVEGGKPRGGRKKWHGREGGREGGRRVGRC